MELRQGRLDVAIARVRWWRVGLMVFGLVACVVLLRTPYIPWDIYVQEPFSVVAGNSFRGRYAVEESNTYYVLLVIPRRHCENVEKPFWREDGAPVRVTVNDGELRPVHGCAEQFGFHGNTAVVLGRYRTTPFHWFEVHADVRRTVPEYPLDTELWIEPEYHGMVIHDGREPWFTPMLSAIVGILVIVSTLLWLGREGTS